MTSGDRLVSLLNWGGSFPWQDGETGFTVRALPYGAAQLEAVLIEPYQDLVVYPGAERAMGMIRMACGVRPQTGAAKDE